MRFLTMLACLLAALGAAAQARYYKGPSGTIYSEQDYLRMKKELGAKGKVYEKLAEIKRTRDSVIVSFRLSIMTDKNGASITNPYDVYEQLFVGRPFPIQYFKDAAGRDYPQAALAGKPSVVHFWFTRCPPCIEELPELNSLKAKFGNQIHFIAITYDDAATVNKFLKKHPLSFSHITDAGEGVGKLGIAAYPMTLILDKNGIVISVDGMLTDPDIIADQLSAILRN